MFRLRDVEDLALFQGTRPGHYSIKIPVCDDWKSYLCYWERVEDLNLDTPADIAVFPAPVLT